MSQPSIRKNFIYRVLYELLVLITPFITTPYIARILGADGNGIYSYTSSIMGIFTMLASLGTMTYGTREIAQHRDDPKAVSKLFWEIEFLTIITSTVCLLLWAALCFFYHEYAVYLIALSPMLLGTMFDINWFYTGYEKIKYTVIRNAVVKISGIILTFLLVKRKGDLVIYILIHSLGMMLGNLSLWTYLPKMIVKTEFRTLTLRNHLRETMIYFIPSIATSVYTILDKTLIGLITHDNYQNGYYEQATKIINILKALVFSSVNAVMTARISYLFSNKNYSEIKERIHRSLDFILLLGYGCVFGLIGIANDFVPLFFGDGYQEVIVLLYIMSPLIVIVGISNCIGYQYYTPSGQRMRSAKVIVLGSIVNLLLNLLLIPKYGSKGAVVATLFAESLISFLYVRMSNGYMSAKVIIASSYKRIIAGIIMCCAVYYLGYMQTVSRSEQIIRLLFQTGLGVVVYFSILYLFKDSMLRELLRIIGNISRKVFNKRQVG